MWLVKWAGKAWGKSPGSPCKPEPSPVRSGSRVMCVSPWSLRLHYGVTLPQTHYINYHLLIALKSSQQGGGEFAWRRMSSLSFTLYGQLACPLRFPSPSLFHFPCFKPVFDFALANETAVGEIGSEQSIFVMRSEDGAPWVNVCTGAHPGLLSNPF